MKEQWVPLVVICVTAVLIALIASLTWMTVKGQGKTAASVVEALAAVASLMVLLAYCGG